MGMGRRAGKGAVDYTLVFLDEAAAAVAERFLEAVHMDIHSLVLSKVNGRFISSRLKPQHIPIGGGGYPHCGAADELERLSPESSFLFRPFFERRWDVDSKSEELLSLSSAICRPLRREMKSLKRRNMASYNRVEKRDSELQNTYLVSLAELDR